MLGLDMRMGYELVLGQYTISNQHSVVVSQSSFVPPFMALVRTVRVRVRVMVRVMVRVGVEVT